MYMHTRIVFESRKLRCKIHKAVIVGAIITSPMRQILYTELCILMLYMLHTHTHTHTHTLHACACACASAVLQSKVKLSTDTELYYDEAVAVSGVTRLRTGRPGELFDFWLEYRRFSSSSIQTASAVLKRPVREADNSLPFRA